MKLEEMKKSAESFAWSVFYLTVATLLVGIIVTPVWMLVAILGE